MLTYLRLLVLALALAYSVIFGPGTVFAHGTRIHRHKAMRTRAQRSNLFRAKVVAPPIPIGSRLVEYARRFVGVPYVWGGSSPSGFDCSGFVRYVYQRFGVQLPHSSFADFDLGQTVSRWALKPGDLVFFDGVGHVGMYVGSGRFIHAPHTGTDVQVSTLAGYGGSYDGARRIFTGVARYLLRG